MLERAVSALREGEDAPRIENDPGPCFAALPGMRRAADSTRSSTAAPIFTVGHSTRSLEELVDLLWSHGVATLADIRTIPRSARNPQFNRDALVKELPRFGLAYAHVPELGGLRKPRPDSPNGAWRNA